MKFVDTFAGFPLEFSATYSHFKNNFTKQTVSARFCNANLGTDPASKGDLSGASFFIDLAAEVAQGGRRDGLRLESNFQAPLFRRGEMCYNIKDFHILRTQLKGKT